MRSAVPLPRTYKGSLICNSQNLETFNSSIYRQVNKQTNEIYPYSVIQQYKGMNYWYINLIRVMLYERSQRKKGRQERREPWLVWLSGLSTVLQTKWSLVQFPVRTHVWLAGQVPSEGCMRSNHTLMFLSLSFPSPLSGNKWIKGRKRGREGLSVRGEIYEGAKEYVTKLKRSASWCAPFKKDMVVTR